MNWAQDDTSHTVCAERDPRYDSMSNENTAKIAHILYDRSLTTPLLRCGMAAPYVRAISDKTCQQKMSTPTTTSTTPTSTRGIGLSANIHKRTIFSPTLRGQPNRDSIHCTSSLHSTAQQRTAMRPTNESRKKFSRRPSVRPPVERIKVLQATWQSRILHALVWSTVKLCKPLSRFTFSMQLLLLLLVLLLLVLPTNQPIYYDKEYYPYYNKC